MEKEYKKLFDKIYEMNFRDIQKKYQYLGQGISRIVFGVDKNYVIKLAKGVEGYYQNSVEIYVYENAKHYKDFLCPIEWSEKEMVVMRRAIPLTNYTNSKTVNLTKMFKNPEVFKKLMNFKEEFYMLEEDIWATSSWGILDNKFVLIDYGCTDDEGDNFYDKELSFKFKF